VDLPPDEHAGEEFAQGGKQADRGDGDEADLSRELDGYPEEDEEQHQEDVLEGAGLPFQCGRARWSV